MRHLLICTSLTVILAAFPAVTHSQERHEGRDREERHDRHEREKHHAWEAHDRHVRSFPEHPDRLVRAWHERFFHHAPPGPWVERWVHELQTGAAPEEIVSQILASPDFYAQAGGTAEGFVRALFIDLVGRPPTPDELDFWVRRLYTEDRQDVAYDMVTRYSPVWISEEPADVVVPEYRDPVYRYHH